MEQNCEKSEKSDKKICIYGAGAMGTSLGALFSRAGIACDLVTRSREHAAALNGAGARIYGEAEFTVPVTALLPDELTEQYDLIFLAAKQKENAQIACFLNEYLKEDGALVSVQNGLPEEALCAVLGKDRVYGCALSWGAERTEAGRVRITSANGYRFSLGGCGKGERLSEIARLLEKLGVVTVGKIEEIRFAKLAVNASFSTLSAITGLSFGELSRKYKKQVLSLMRETFAVARACGCEKLPLNGHDLYKVFGGALAKPLLPVAMKKYRETRSGMLKDLQEGRRCEIDYIAGAVVRAGRECAVCTPCLERAVALVHEIENGFAEIAPESAQLLR